MNARRHIDAQAHVVGIEDSILIGELLLLLKEKEFSIRVLLHCDKCKF